MLVSSLIEMSLRKIGALSTGETIETTRQAEALSALQLMLRSWGSLSNQMFATVKESFPLVAGQTSYTWGITTGNFNSTRPTQVLGAYILDSSGTTHPVDITSEGYYRSISSKTTSGRPTNLFFYPSYPLATVYMYPVPDAVETLYVDAFKPFTETASFDVVGSTIAFPAYYEEAIVFNLAIRLAPEYGKTASAEVSAVAKSSFRDVTTINAANQVEPIFALVPAGGSYGARYSINTDTYR